jgi:hypothetical protein
LPFAPCPLLLALRPLPFALCPSSSFPRAPRLPKNRDKL